MDHRIIDGAKGADFLKLLSKELVSYQNGGDQKVRKNLLELNLRRLNIFQRSLKDG